MKSLWNMLNKEFTIEGAVSAFLVINIIAWTDQPGGDSDIGSAFGY